MVQELLVPIKLKFYRTYIYRFLLALPVLLPDKVTFLDEEKSIHVLTLDHIPEIDKIVESTPRNKKFEKINLVA